MPPLAIMFKTVSSRCNLDCSYCYYRESLSRGNRVEIEPAVLDRVIPQYLEYVADAGEASFSWQGGEPTLAGVPFFERALELATRHARPGTRIAHTLQTNGILLDERWAELLAAHRFLVGVSVDGPEDVHDTLRRDRRGRGTFRQVMAGIELLRRHGVDVNALCVVAPHNVRRGRELLRFFRREGLQYVQVMPAMDFQATAPGTPASYLVSAAEYGDLLVEMFEEWYGDGVPTVSIRALDSLLQGYLGLPSDLCIHAAGCSSSLVVEHNGDVFPCDFFIHPGWRLGNVLATPLADLAASPERLAFVNQKRQLPAECRECRWRAVCNSGCPRNRVAAEGGEPGGEFFCAAYRRLLDHADARLHTLAERMVRHHAVRQKLDRLKMTGQSVPDRNDPCPCGSRRRFKECCGHPALGLSFLFE